MEIFCPRCGEKCEITDSCYDREVHLDELVEKGMAYCENCDIDVLFTERTPLNRVDSKLEIKEI